MPRLQNLTVLVGSSVTSTSASAAALRGSLRDVIKSLSEVPLGRQASLVAALGPLTAAVQANQPAWALLVQLRNASLAVPPALNAIQASLGDLQAAWASLDALPDWGSVAVQPELPIAPQVGGWAGGLMSVCGLVGVRAGVGWCVCVGRLGGGGWVIGGGGWAGGLMSVCGLVWVGGCVGWCGLVGGCVGWVGQVCVCGAGGPGGCVPGVGGSGRDLNVGGWLGGFLGDWVRCSGAGGGVVVCVWGGGGGGREEPVTQ
jgi:hypothetical protein